jgi:VWFA-related protein
VKTAAPVRITLDVLVTDSAGKPVPDLEPLDFTLLDDNQSSKILGFRRVDGTVGNKSDPPVEVIIVLDAVNMPYQAVTQLRLQLQKFLRRNGGHLAQPVSVFVFASDGLQVQPAPSKDGNALAAMLDTSAGTVRALGAAAGDYGLGEQFSKSTQTIKGIAENEARKPGRKLLIWLGSGWPLLDSPHFIKSNEGEQRHFMNIVDVSKKLREARITVYGIYTLNSSSEQFLYEAYLKPVRDFHHADAGNLSMQVLARQTGGRVLPPGNDIAGQIDSCVADIGAYYTIAFAAPAAAQANEYHDLKVVVGQPGLTVRTNSGYYNQP